MLSRQQHRQTKVRGRLLYNWLKIQMVRPRMKLRRVWARSCLRILAFAAPMQGPPRPSKLSRTRGRLVMSGIMFRGRLLLPSPTAVPTSSPWPGDFFVRWQIHCSDGTKAVRLLFWSRSTSKNSYVGSRGLGWVLGKRCKKLV